MQTHFFFSSAICAATSLERDASLFALRCDSAIACSARSHIRRCSSNFSRISSRSRRSSRTVARSDATSLCDTAYRVAASRVSIACASHSASSFVSTAASDFSTAASLIDADSSARRISIEISRIRAADVACNLPGRNERGEKGRTCTRV